MAITDTTAAMTVAWLEAAATGGRGEEESTEVAVIDGVAEEVMEGEPVTEGVGETDGVTEDVEVIVPVTEDVGVIVLDGVEEKDGGAGGVRREMPFCPVLLARTMETT